MEDPESNELSKTIRDLSESSFRYKRYNAAVKLGALIESNEDIIRVLAATVALDDDVEVRSAAMQALQSTVHQAFLKDRPDFIQEATQSAVEKRERERWGEEQSFRNEFLARRTRERIRILSTIGGLVVFCILLLIGLFQGWMDRSRLCVWQFVFMAFAILIAYMSWRNWRCPSCDSWLSGFTFNINPIWSPDIVRCPHCGKRIL